MGELHKCKYCGVETTQPDDECYAKPAKTMTAVEFYRKELNALVSLGKTEFKTESEIFNKALEIEKQQKKQTVLNLLNHDLGHDDTARWLAERLEAGIIDVNDL